MFVDLFLHVMCQQWDTLYTNINGAEYWITQAPGLSSPKLFKLSVSSLLFDFEANICHLNFMLTY